jgi:hypothetical protein
MKIKSEDETIGSSQLSANIDKKNEKRSSSLRLRKSYPFQGRWDYSNTIEYMEEIRGGSHNEVRGSVVLPPRRCLDPTLWKGAPLVTAAGEFDGLWHASVDDS